MPTWTMLRNDCVRYTRRTGTSRCRVRFVTSPDCQNRTLPHLAVVASSSLRSGWWLVTPGVSESQCRRRLLVPEITHSCITCNAHPTTRRSRGDGKLGGSIVAGDTPRIAVPACEMLDKMRMCDIPMHHQLVHLQGDYY
ncbi:unnamed protein product [Urochloa humidicola]